jgi:hypothetical protein
LRYQIDGNWVEFATVSTNSNGEFTQEWTPPDEGVYKIMARFEGDSNYEWSTSETTIQVTSAPAPTPEFPKYGTPDFPAYPAYPDYTPIFAGIIAAVVVVAILVVYAIVSIRKPRK